MKLAEIKDINFDELKTLVFQLVFSYKDKKEGKYVRIITKQLKVSDNKEEVNGQSNLNIVSTSQIQKSAKLASIGKLKDAQAQIHIARNFLNQNSRYIDNKQIYHQFNKNMNSFHYNLNRMNFKSNALIPKKDRPILSAN